VVASSTPTRTPTRTPTVTATNTPGACVDTDGDTQCNTVDLDDDNDGCTDVRELGADPGQGGDRDPLYFWDFFDITGDRTIDVADAVAILAFFGLPHDHPNANLRDREAGPVDKPWRTVEANNGVDLRDALALFKGFGHSCV
jgi:hypothetical protein